MRSIAQYLGLISLFVTTTTIHALSYPVTTPAGETTGGTYRLYFDNIFTSETLCDGANMVVGGFNNIGQPICVTPVSTGLYVTGQTIGDTLRFDGSSWVRNNLIYNNGTSVGIANQTPGYLFDVGGTANFLGIRMPTGASSGYVLSSDASGVARWTNSPNISLSGVTGGSQYVVPKFGLGGTGLILSSIYDDGVTVGINTLVPSASYKLDVVGGDSRINGIRFGVGGGNLTSNVAIGLSAFGSNITSPNNVVIGNLAGTTLTAGAGGNILIGNAVNTTTATSSNELNIGNWIYGSGGNIGIGTGAGISTRLKVDGQIQITGGSPGAGKYLQSDASGIAIWTGVTASMVTATGITGGTEYYLSKFGVGGNGLYASVLYESGGKIGLNTINPSVELDVNGTIRVRSGGSLGYVFTSDASGIGSWQAPGVSMNTWNIIGNAGTTAGTNFLGTTDPQDLVFKANSTEWMRILTNGRVGIGTASPGQKLTLSGGNFQLINGTEGNGRMLISDANGVSSWTGVIVATSLNLAGAVTGSTLFYRSGAWNVGTGIYNAGGNIGIGTVTPGSSLEVAGQVKITGGTPGAGKFLVSDASGLASWQNTTATLSGTYWSLSGNTTGVNDFIGTTNSQDLVLKTNNTEKIRIYSTSNSSGQIASLSGGDLVINNIPYGKGNGTSIYNIAIGQNTLASNTTSDWNIAIGNNALKLNSGGTSNRNIAIGVNALASNTVHSSSIAIGENALTSNNMAGNVAIGASALFSNTTGLGNTALGFNALRLSDGTGSSNTAVGFGGGYSIMGIGNTMLGYMAGTPTTGTLVASGGSSSASNMTSMFGTDNTFLGNDTQYSGSLSNATAVGANVVLTQSNTVVLGNGANVGIGTSTPGTKLEVSGQVKITGGTPGAGKFLVSDATGLASWQNSTATLSGTYWSLSGNTAGPNDFVGTLNAQDLILKSNNAQIARFYYSGGVSIGTGNTLSSSVNTFVVGNSNLVNGNNISIVGYNNRIANGTFDGLVLGNNNTMSGGGWPVIVGRNNSSLSTYDNPTIFGRNNEATYHDVVLLGMTNSGGGEANQPSLAVGSYNQVGDVFIGFREESTAVGQRNRVLNQYSSAFGRLNTITTSNSSVFGANITNNIAGSTQIGPNNTAKVTIFTGGQVAIGTSVITTGATLKVAGQVEITGGTPGVGKFLVSDATGLASWQSTTATLSGTYWSLSGNTVGANDYIGTNNGQNLRFYSSGSQKMVLDTNGNLGIGIASAGTNKLYVNGDTYISGALSILGKLYVDTIVSRTVTNVTVSGSLLPDSSTPVAYRDLGSNTQRWNNAYLTGQITIGGGSPAAGRMLISDANGLASWTGVIVATNLNLAGAVTGSTIFFRSGAWNVGTGIFNDGGNIGIGTATPGAALEVAGQVKITGGSPGLNKVLTSDASGLATWTTAISSLSGSFWSLSGNAVGANDYIGTNNAQNVRFYSSGSQKMVLDTNGNLGIGSTAPGQKLTVSGGTLQLVNGSQANGRMLISDASGIASWTGVITATSLNLAGGVTGSTIYYNSGSWLVGTGLFNNGTRVGIGTATPGAALEVAGQVKITGGVPGAGKVLTSDATGLAYWTGAITATALSIPGATTGATLYFTSGSWQAGTGFYNVGGNVAIGTTPAADAGTKLLLNSGLTGTSGLRFSQVTSASAVVSTNVIGLGVDGLGNVVPISNGDVIVYDGLTSYVPSPNPDNPNREVSYDFNQYFRIPAKQSFVVTDGLAPGQNAPYIGANASSSVCEWTGTVGTGITTCPTGDFPGSPYNSFTMSARSDANYGYQIGLAYRGDIQLMARSGKFRDGSDAGTDVDFDDYGSGLYINGTSTPAPWYKVLTLPTNHVEWLYIDTGYTGQWNATSNDGNVGIGTTTPVSRFEIWNHNSGSVMMHFRGSNNIGMGSGSVRIGQTGNANSGYGHESLYTLTSGYSNTAVGYRAQRLTTTGFNNSALGQEALYNNAGGSWNTALGYQASYSNTSGTGNIALGSLSLYYNAIGANNIALGYYALRGTSGNSTSNNIAIGLNTLSGATGNNNIAIGAEAGTNQQGGANNITLGYNAEVGSPTGSDQLSIGNWIYGSGGNIGIASSNPTSKFDVNGTFKLGTSGTQLNSIIKASVTLDVPSVATLACSAQTLTVTNAAVGGTAMVSPANALTDRMIIAYARVSAANTVEVKFCNESVAAIDLASMTYYVTVIQ